MVKPKDYKGMSDLLSYQFQDLEKRLIWDIARRIKSETNGEGEYTQTAEKQMQDLTDMGYDLKRAREMIANALGESIAYADTMIWKYGTEVYADDHGHYAKVGKTLVDFERNGFVQNMIRATQSEVKENLLNLSNTTGFVDAKGKFFSVDDYYIREMDKAVFQVASGAFDVQSVMRRVVKELGNSGVRTVNFNSGTTRSLESAVRTNILTGISQLAGKISLQNAIDMGEDLMEITAHAGARPTHSLWQGRIVSLSGRKGYLSTIDISYGDITGFKGANCYHDWYTFFEGISEPKYTQEQLDEFNDQSKKYEFNGKLYSEYEAGQKMRQIERSMAKTKRELVGYDAIADKEMFIAKSIFLRRQRDLYDEFAAATGKEKLPMNQMVYNFDRKKAAQATWAYKKLDRASDKMYNSNEVGKYYKDYLKSVKTGFISPLVDFEDYIKYKSRIDREIIGKTTSNGIEIKSQSKHFIERVFGTMRDPKTGKPRNGVDFEDVKDALLNGRPRSQKKDLNGNVVSVKLVTDKAEVSINPITGNLIQCNPS